MTADAATPRPAVEETRSRLRLKRLFLRTLVVSLSACALVAVLALLLGTFNEFTQKVLSTLGALAVHSGVAMVCAHWLERRRRPRFSGLGLVVFGANFIVLITCIWRPGWFGETTGRAALTTGALLGLYILSLPCADLLERGQWRPLALAGLVAAVVALLMILVLIWVERADNDAFGKATAVMSIVAFSFAHMSLLVRVPTAGSAVLTWLRAGTLIAVWAVAAMVSAVIIWEIDADFWYRFLGALGVLDATGSLALLILVKLRAVGKVEELRTVAPQVELRCPRCTTLQQVEAGAAKCSTCGLKFQIEIEEPRCAKCDYLLWQLPERRCPECGTPF